MNTDYNVDPSTQASQYNEPHGTSPTNRDRLPYFTTSWDDGYVNDIRLACLLAKHGMRGTFYVPGANCEGLPVLTSKQLLEVSQGFEVGGHTLDHYYLDKLPLIEAKFQVEKGKTCIERIINRPIRGFCYPGGASNRELHNIVQSSGFAYSRTTDNLRVSLPSDPFLLPTTIQFFPHKSTVYLRNFLSRGASRERFDILRLALSTTDLYQRLILILEAVCHSGGVFHLWGHSWEIDQFDGWGMLDRFLAHVAQVIPPAQRLDNGSVFDMSAGLSTRIETAGVIR